MHPLAPPPSAEGWWPGQPAWVPARTFTVKGLDPGSKAFGKHQAMAGASAGLSVPIGLRQAAESCWPAFRGACLGSVLVMHTHGKQFQALSKVWNPGAAATTLTASCVLGTQGREWPRGLRTTQAQHAPRAAQQTRLGLVCRARLPGVGVPPTTPHLVQLMCASVPVLLLCTLHWSGQLTPRHFWSCLPLPPPLGRRTHSRIQEGAHILLGVVVAVAVRLGPLLLRLLRLGCSFSLGLGLAPLVPVLAALLRTWRTLLQRAAVQRPSLALRGCDPSVQGAGL